MERSRGQGRHEHRQFLVHFPARSDSEAAASQVRLATADVAWRTFTWARLHAAHGGGRTYGYVFSRVPPWRPFATLHAAGHGAELPYLFGFPPRLAFFASTWPWRASRDAAIAEEIQEYWTRFARTGDPNGSGLPTWSQLGAGSVLDFADTTHMAEIPDPTGLALMDAHWWELRTDGAANP
jgi:para-nitrobenzyl esterase